MGFTISASGGYNAGSGNTSVSLTITVGAGKCVGVVCFGTPEAVITGGAGTLVDNNSVSYTAINYNYNAGQSSLQACFAKIATTAATSLTWTPPVATGGYYQLMLGAWVFSATGTPTCTGSALNFTDSASTSLNGVTTGSMTTNTSDGLILGMAYNR